MTKIITGVTGLVATVALVGSVAFAQFSAQVTASNVVFATGNAALEVTDPTEVGGDGFGSTLNLSSVSTGEFTPGEVLNQNFQIRNSGDVDLDLTLQLTSATGDWGVLNSVFEVRLYPVETAEEDKPTFATFATWNSAPQSLPQNPIAAGATEDWTVEVRLNSSADNTAAGKTVNTNWVLNGVEPTP